MKYQIDISGMYCSGCSNLIKIFFEDEGFYNAEVDRNANIAMFESDLEEISDIKRILDRVFSDIPKYSYRNIKVLNQ